MRSVNFCIAALALCLLFSSCGKSNGERAFSYQDGGISLTGELTRGGAQYGIILEMNEQDASGERSVIRLEYTAPKNLCGVVCSIEDGSAKATVGGLEINVSEETAAEMLEVSRLFSLDEADITDISHDGKKTVITASSTERLYTVLTDGNGVPEKITENADGAEASLEITSFTVTPSR